MGDIYDLISFVYVNLYGYQTNSTDNLIIGMQQLEIQQDYCLSKLLRTDSERGDSSGPIVHHTSENEAILLGLHVGKLCSSYFNSTAPSPIIVDLQGSIYCESTNTGLKVISVWENIAEELGIE